MSRFSNSSSHHGGKDEVQTSRASPSSILPFLSEQQYEVFLSFRGETRRGFTDHLYTRLINAKVSVFRDKEGLPIGERNWPKIVKAIENSKISIPIISPDYASSEWCLNELIEILKYKKMSGQLVIPIFYRVTPSDLRKKLDVLEEESQPCKKRRLGFDGTHVQKWKDALMEVSYMTGLESEKTADGYEGELVEIVLTKVLEALKALRKPILDVSDDLVGVDCHVKKITEMASVEGSNVVHAVLIHGMGGIGKTTLAKVMYNRLAQLFDCYSFLANIRETWWSQHKGRMELQEQLISDILGKKESISSVDAGAAIIRERFKNKKVLILLDDVDHRGQLNALAGKWDWFGRGSMLIFTSRIKDVLKEWEGSFTYELKGLNDDQSFQLFCKHAFKKCPIPNEFHTIAKEIVSTTGGLPLAIEVIGCLLHSKDPHFWGKKLEKLKKIPENEVQNKLRISFDALQHEAKQMFLDIACLPIREEEERKLAFYMWGSCGFYPDVTIDELTSMSLIKIGEGGELIIHDQLRDLAIEIVRQQGINNLGKRSRLWRREEVEEVLELKEGTGAVEALYLPIKYGIDSHYRLYREKLRCTSEQFEGMTELRYLHMREVVLTGDCGNLFQKLRWLDWGGSTWDFIESNFIPKQLVILGVYDHKGITEKWMGWREMKRLKVLRLNFCNGLTTIPDLSALEELEFLWLGSCHGLIEIHPSIGKLRKLKILLIFNCTKLKVPREVGEMKEIRELTVSRMRRVREIPISKGYMTKLETLTVTSCEKIKCIPDSVDSLVMLRRLVLTWCKFLTEIPKSIGNLRQLIEINLEKTGVTQLPDSIRDLCKLELLILVDTPIRCLPTSIRMLSKLQLLDLWGCYQLESLPSLPCSLTSLEFSGYSMETLPDFSSLTNLEVLLFKDYFSRWSRSLDFRNLDRMRTLQIHYSMVQLGISDSAINRRHKDHGIFKEHGYVLNASEVSKNINSLQELPSKLVEVEITKCYALQTLPNFSNLKDLSLLSIRSCPVLMKIDGLDGAKKLEDLTIIECRNLVGINGLDKAESIRKMMISGCPSLERIGDLSHLKMLTTLELCGCDKLSDIGGILMSVTKLILKGLIALESLPDLSTAKKLENLKIVDCKNLIEINGLDKVESIEEVSINQCPSLERFDDLSHLKMLTTLELCGCDKLSDIGGIGMSVTKLILKGFNALESMPDLSTAKKLEDLKIVDCKSLVEINGLNNVNSIQKVSISQCPSLERIGDLSHLNMLTTLELHHCYKLSEIQGLENLPSNMVLKICGCTALRDLPKDVIICDTHGENVESESDFDHFEEEYESERILSDFDHFEEEYESERDSD